MLMLMFIQLFILWANAYYVGYFVMDCSEPAISIAHDIDLTLDLSCVLMLMLMLMFIILIVYHVYFFLYSEMDLGVAFYPLVDGVASRKVLFSSFLPRTNPMSSHCAWRDFMSPAWDEPWSTALSSTLVGITAPALHACMHALTVCEAIGCLWCEQLVCSMIQLAMARQWIIVWTCTFSCTWHRLSDLFCETTLLFHFSLFLISNFLFPCHSLPLKCSVHIFVSNSQRLYMCAGTSLYWVSCVCFLYFVSISLSLHLWSAHYTCHAEFCLDRSFACVPVLHCWGIVCSSLLYCVKCIMLVMWYAFTQTWSFNRLMLAQNTALVFFNSKCLLMLGRVLDLTELVFFDIGTFYWTCEEMVLAWALLHWLVDHCSASMSNDEETRWITERNLMTNFLPKETHENMAWPLFARSLRNIFMPLIHISAWKHCLYLLEALEHIFMPLLLIFQPAFKAFLCI